MNDMLGKWGLKGGTRVGTKKEVIDYVGVVWC